MENIKMPVLFIGHGSPMNVAADNDYTKSLSKLGKSMQRPRAVLVVSAHWLTEGTFVTASAAPEQIYDFFGFPQKLYGIKYPCAGSPATAASVIDALSEFGAEADNEWGIDHAAWAVLFHMYPAADIPVIEVSIDIEKPPERHFEIGKKLRRLREEGVLIIGSGNIVHNLGKMDFQNTDAAAYDWASEFDGAIKSYIENREFDKINGYKNLGRAAKLSAPTPEHFYPLLYALGASDKADQVSFPHEGIQNASISMRSVMFQN